MVSVKGILNDCSAGRSILEHYELNGHLNNGHRDRIINAVVEYVVEKNIKLKPLNFEQFLNEIQLLFPEEKSYLVGNKKISTYEMFINDFSKLGLLLHCAQRKKTTCREILF